MKTNRMLFSSRASASTSRAHLEAATTKARVNFETARAAESMGDEALAFGSSNVKEAPISPLKFEQQDFAATAAGAKVAPIAAEPSSVVQRSATVQWRELRRQMLNAPQRLQSAGPSHALPRDPSPAAQQTWQEAVARQRAKVKAGGAVAPPATRAIAGVRAAALAVGVMSAVGYMAWATEKAGSVAVVETLTPLPAAPPAFSAIGIMSENGSNVSAAPVAIDSLQPPAPRRVVTYSRQPLWLQRPRAGER